MARCTRWLLPLLLGLPGPAARAQPVPGDGGPALKAQAPRPAADPQAIRAKIKVLHAEAGRLYKEGKLAHTVPLAEQVLALLRKLYPAARYPAGHPELAVGLNNLGMALKAAGQAAVAEPYLRQALVMKRACYPPGRFPRGHAELANSLLALGVLLHDRGALAQAEPLLREALLVREKLQPPERFPDGHADVATAADCLGLLLLDRGDLGQAEPLLRRALAVREKVYPPERFPDGHFHLALSFNHLGRLLKARGELTLAEPFYRRSLALREKLFPPERFPQGHVEVAVGLNNLAALLGDRGELDRAESLTRRAVAMYRALYPPGRFPAGHPDLARGLENLGVLLRVRGELDRAEPVFREALVMCRKLYPGGRYPAGHPALARSLTELGALLRAQHALVEAEPLLRQAVAVDEGLYSAERFPAGHPDLATALNNLGDLHKDRGELAQAEALYRRALALREAHFPTGRFPAGHPQLVSSLDSLGALLALRGELSAAEPFFRRAVDLRRRLYPPERLPAGHPDLARSLNQLGELLRARGELAAAEPLYREALDMAQTLYPAERFPDGHPDAAGYLHNLAELLRAREDYARAEPLYRRALAIQRKLYPPEHFPRGHPDLVATLNNLGRLLDDRGNLAEAEALFRWALAMLGRLYPADHFPDGHPDLVRVRNNLGFVLYVRGERVEAEEAFREALAMHQRLGELFLGAAAEAEGLNYLASLPTYRDHYLSVTRAAPQRDAEGCQAVWRGRALLFRLAEHRRLALAGADAATGAVARQLVTTRQELGSLLLTPLRGARHGERVRELSARKEELEKELARRLPSFAALRRRHQGGPDELARALPADTAFVELVRYGRFEHDPRRPGRAGRSWPVHYAAFVAAAGGRVRRVELGPAGPVDRAVAAWRAALAGRGRELDLVPARPRPGGEQGPAGQALRRLVWQPLARHLPDGTRTLYLAPDGTLTQLPWAALPGARADTVLLEDYALAVVPHGELLLEALTAGKAGRPRPPVPAEDKEGILLAVGGVSYGAGRQGAVARWPALPGTARELERVLALAGKRPVLARRGREASTMQVLADLPRARWAHLATHGFFADPQVRSALRLSEKDYERGRLGERVGAGARSPLVLSGLVLAGANQPFQDPSKKDGGILTAEAVAGLRLEGLDLTVLSACDTGLGEVAGGEGAFGLQRAFHVAGAKNVVASLWQVDDEATAALMARFYHGLWVEKLPPLEALRRAQLTLYRHPERIPALARERGPAFDRVARRPPEPRAGARAPARLWAGFVLSGDGR
jgi:CHAT domain-containing protein/tetratricopeptide (TPR) repeat protein